MDHAAPVRIRQCVADVLEQTHEASHVERSVSVHAFGETLAFDEAHREREHAVAVLDGVNGDDVRMRERRRGSGLAEEPLAERAIAGELRWEHLERDRPVELEIAREIDGAHAAATELALDGVTVAEPAANVVEGGGGRRHGHRLGRGSGARQGGRQRKIRNYQYLPRDTGDMYCVRAVRVSLSASSTLWSS